MRVSLQLALLSLLVVLPPHAASADPPADRHEGGAPTSAQGEMSKAQKGPLDVIAAVIAIPVTCIGAVYTFMLIMKAAAETRKIKLDIQKAALEVLEKQKAVGSIGPAEESRIKEIVSPAEKEDRRRQLLPRLVVLFIVEIVGAALIGSYDRAFRDLGSLPGANGGYLFSEWLYNVLDVIAYVLIVAYWVIVLAIAWPLFRIANELLGFKVKEFFTLGRRRTEGNEPGRAPQGKDTQIVDPKKTQTTGHHEFTP